MSDGIKQGWIDRVTMAKSCGVAVVTFSSWGVVEVGKYKNRKYYTVKDVINNRLEHRIRASVSVNSSGSEEAQTIDGARLLEIRAKTAKLDIENSIRRKEFAPVSIISHVLGKLCAQINATLESIPIKLKRRCPQLRAPDLEVVKGEIVKCQNLASALTIDLDDYTDQK